MRFVHVWMMFLPVMVISWDLRASYQFVKKQSRRWGIDDSHNHLHSKEVLFWSKDIMDRLPFSILHDDRVLIGRCCLLHDMMDSKYVDLSVETEQHLVAEGHVAEDIRLMMRIMQNMSYSKIVAPDKSRIRFPAWEDGRQEILFHIVREADLLSSYNLARMIEFREGMPSEQIRQEILDLYEIRMGCLIEDGLFYFPSTRERAKQLDALCRLRLTLLPDLDFRSPHQLDILRIVNHLSIDRLLREYHRTGR